jgi:RNA polymerase sigma factor (sigma-70 family)
MLGQLQEAEDVTQDVFVKGIERIEQYREGTSFIAWLHKIAYHECLNKLRRAHIYGRILSRFSRTMPTVQTDLPAEGLEFNAKLREAMLRLAPKERHLILLRIVEENKFEEIAEQLGMSYAAVGEWSFKTSITNPVSNNSQYKTLADGYTSSSDTRYFRLTGYLLTPATTLLNFEFSGDPSWFRIQLKDERGMLVEYLDSSHSTDEDV